MTDWEKEIYMFFGRFNSDTDECIGVVNLEDPTLIVNTVREQRAKAIDELVEKFKSSPLTHDSTINQNLEAIAEEMKK